MQVPVVIINAVVVVILALIGVIFRTTLVSRMDRMETYFNSKIDSIETEFKEFLSTINSSMERRGVATDDSIEKIVASLTPRSHCDSRQELWNTRFAAMLETNKKEHLDIENTLKGLSDLIKELSDCVLKISMGAKNC